MNPVIRAQLREYAVSASLMAEIEDTQFEIYSIFSVLTGSIGENIEAYDVHLKGDEFGIDGIAILIQGELVRDRQQAEEKLSAINNPTIEFIFFQSKSGTSFDYGNISKFFDGISGFFSDGMKGESDQMDDLIGAMEIIYESGVGKRNPKLSCYYVTTGNYEKPTRIEKLKNGTIDRFKALNIFDDASIAIEFVGAKELQQFYRAATSSVDAEFEFPRNVVMPTNKNVEEAYIGYIDADNLLKLIVSKDASGGVGGINRAVFFDNIRDYDPKSKINVSIKDSVKLGEAVLSCSVTMV